MFHECLDWKLESKDLKQIMHQVLTANTPPKIRSDCSIFLDG